MSATASATPAAPARAIPFRFLGSGGEYFRIWIVNLLLTIVTLGIYSAWAKVRRNRYFYGNTRLGDTSFEYLASPVAILKGRLIAFALFMAFALIPEAWPPAQVIGLLLFVGFLPWLIVKSLGFRARNTAFRNLRFDFRGRYGEAAVVFVLIPVLAVVTFGLIVPFLVQRQKRYVVANSAFGTTPFVFGARVADFYKEFLVALLIVVAHFLLFVALLPLSVVLAGLSIVPLYVLLFAFLTVRIANLVYNEARLERHALRSTMRVRDVFVLYLTNALGIAVTFGLFIPWAQVRLARYRAEKMALLAHGDLDGFVAAQQAKVGATGEEIGEMFDIDIGL